MFATIPSATVLGVDGQPVTVEVHVGSGLPAFSVVGLPDTACREARDRIRAAFAISQLAFPPRRITVNLAPSGVRKVGSSTDLAIAVGLAVASEQIGADAVAGLGFIGELGLDGSIRPVAGTVPLLEALAAGTVVVAAASAVEAQVVGGHTVRAVSRLDELVACLRRERAWPELGPVPEPATPVGGPDLGDVRGQPLARFGLEVAAAGRHHLLFVGPPGAGKSMLAGRLPGLLPALDDRQARRVTCIHSAAGIPLPPDGLVRRPPFRAPHHTSSRVSLIGGGTVAMRPGEASLSHEGVLFLDELGEFDVATLDAFRQPLEEGVIRVARAHRSVTYPASFLLVAATNPCPCGDGGPPGVCRCSDHARARYARRLSGPLLDRFDLRVTVGRPDTEALLGQSRGESSAEVAARVERVRRVAGERGVVANGALTTDDLDRVAPLAPAALRLLERALEAGRLTGRGLVRVRRVARTIADLRELPATIDDETVALALGLRGDPLPLPMRAAS